MALVRIRGSVKSPASTCGRYGALAPPGCSSGGSSSRMSCACERCGMRSSASTTNSRDARQTRRRDTQPSRIRWPPGAMAVPPARLLASYQGKSGTNAGNTRCRPKNVGDARWALQVATSSAEKRRLAVTAIPDDGKKYRASPLKPLEQQLTSVARRGLVLQKGDDGAPVLGTTFRAGRARLACARGRRDDDVRERHAGLTQDRRDGTRSLHAQLLIRSDIRRGGDNGNHVVLKPLRLGDQLLQLSPLRSRYLELAVAELHRDRFHGNEIVQGRDRTGGRQRAVLAALRDHAVVLIVGSRS